MLNGILCTKMCILHISKIWGEGGRRGKKNVLYRYRYTHFLTSKFLPGSRKFWEVLGSLLVYSLTETIMILLTALRCCTPYDNRLEKTSQKVIIMRTSRRTYFGLRGWEGIIHLMEQTELHTRVDVILLLLRILLK